MNKPILYSIWHLNLLYSSIEVERRSDVIQKCFWPLLKLAQNNYKVAIEIPASSLEIAYEIAPDWVIEFKKLIQEGKTELIGSGYTQLIAPITPAKVNKVNIEEGFKVYQDLLGCSPKLWLINEQAFSDSLISMYSSFDEIKAIVLDWSALYGNNSNITEDKVYNVQNLVSEKNKIIPVLWSNSIAFQKFQHLVHNQIADEEFFKYYTNIFENIKKANQTSASFCLYGNDAEIFDFRPGRFHTEAQMTSKLSEWEKINFIFSTLSNNFDYRLPSEVLAANSQLTRENIPLNFLSEPTTVKKQPKYNICRWSLTGRNTPIINNQCLNLVKNIDSAPVDTKRTICYLFSSDFRTHITEARWEAFKNQLDELAPLQHNKSQISLDGEAVSETNFESEQLVFQINQLKGGTFEKIGLKNLPHIFGKVPHGYFSRMDLCSDWYSFNTVFQPVGKSQITDLNKTQLMVKKNRDAINFQVKSNFLNGTVSKNYSFENRSPSLNVTYNFNIPTLSIGILRFGFITFNPDEIDENSFEIESHSGGYDTAIFRLPNKEFSHGLNPTNIVSSNNIFPMTENECYIRTRSYNLKLELVNCNVQPQLMLKYMRAKEGNLLRLFFSISETDETRKSDWNFTNIFVNYKVTLTKRYS